DPEKLRPLPSFEGSGATGVLGWIQDGPVVGLLVGGLGLATVLLALVTNRATFDINTVNLLFLFLGLAFQRRLSHYLEAVTDGARGVGGIVLQFPFYFGILGIMQGTGLIEQVSGWVASVASADTFPVLAFLLAGFVNFCVPGGGGQWAVQGEVLATAGLDLGVSTESIVMAFSYGDAWTNMLQPFWALPLLGIMGLQARDIIGYAAVIFLLMGVVVPVFLLWVF